MKADIKRGIKFYHSRKYEQALKEFRMLEEENNLNIEVIYYIGLCLTQLGRYDDALLYLEQVVQSEFSFLHVFQSRMVLGFIYSVTARYKLAEYEFNKLISSGLESSQIYAALGYVYYSQKKVKESIEALEKALELDPDNPNALNSLGFILAEEEIDIGRAVKLCREAVKRKPKNPAYLDSLGWALYKRGKYLEAKDALRRALDLMPGNSEIVSHMKEVLMKIKSEK